MSRKIKFRAFSKETGKMMHWDFINSVKNLHKLLSLNHVEVMQFTGLYDKDGKEIYEGDIIKFKYNTGGDIIGEIIWSIGGYYVVKTSDKKWNQKVIPYPLELELIGNIYENSDLLSELS